MKIDVQVVARFLKELQDVMLAALDGACSECPDEWTRQFLAGQSDEVNRIIGRFQLQHLTPKNDEMPSKGPVYTKRIEALVDKRNELLETKGKMEASEVVELYKGELWFRFWRNLRDVEIPVAPHGELLNFLEAEVVDKTFTKTQKETFYSNGFFYSSLSVLSDVATEIINRREKNPQQNLFPQS